MTVNLIARLCVGDHAVLSVSLTVLASNRYLVAA